ncbi:MAG: MFS transporter, partial [Armatimonadota bacterium]
WGAAAFWSGSSTRALDVSDRRARYGLSAGTLYAATHVGFLAGTLLLGPIGNAWGPPAAFYVALHATAVGVVVLAFLPRRDFPREAPTLRGIVKMAFSPKGGIVAFLLLTSSLGFGLLLGAFSERVEDTFGLAWGGVIAAAYPAARLFMAFVGATLSDALGRHRVFFGAFALASLCLAASTVSEHAVSLALAALALGALNGAVPPTAMALIGDSADRSRRRLAYGALFVWRDLGVAAAIVFSKMLQVMRGEYDAPFAAFAAIFGVCAVPALLLGRRTDERL